MKRVITTNVFTALALWALFIAGAQPVAAQSVHAKLPGDIKSIGQVFYEASERANPFPSANNPLKYSDIQNIPLTAR
jgi:hypothetical protein